MSAFSVQLWEIGWPHCKDILTFSLTLMAAVIKIHILEEASWQFLEPALGSTDAWTLMRAIIPMTSFICVLSFLQTFTIRMLPFNNQVIAIYAKYMKGSIVTYILFLAVSGLLETFLIYEKTLMTIYLSLIYLISIIVVYEGRGILQSAITLSSLYLSLILVISSLACVLNRDMLSMEFIMICMVFYASILIAILLMLNHVYNPESGTGPAFNPNVPEGESLDAVDNSQICENITKSQEDETAKEVSGQEGDVVQRTLDKKDICSDNREAGESQEEIGNTNDAEAIISDLSCHLKVINDCTVFLLSKT